MTRTCMDALLTFFDAFLTIHRNAKTTIADAGESRLAICDGVHAEVEKAYEQLHKAISVYADGLCKFMSCLMGSDTAEEGGS